jgi:hypothetical protein
VAGALPAALRRKTDAVWRDAQDELAASTKYRRWKRLKRSLWTTRG